MSQTPKKNSSANEQNEMTQIQPRNRGPRQVPVLALLGWRQIAVLFLISMGAVLVHGYHPGVEDTEFYLPAVIKHLNPRLYPFNDQYFMSHARMTLFADIVAGSVRLTHLPLDWAIFLWHFACIFLLLLGCWRISRICFRDERASWGSVALVAALLTIPVAGTALYIMDQYLNPRDMSTAAIVLLLAEAMKRRFVVAGIGMLFIATIHPLMSLFGISLLVLLFLELQRTSVSGSKLKPAAAVATLLLIPWNFFPQPSPVYRDLLAKNISYFLVTRWQWSEWLGILVPLLLLWWLAGYGRKHELGQVQALSRALILFTLIFLAMGLFVCIPSMARFALLQPMRSLHVVFILLFVLLGGILAQAVLKSYIWRWAVVFLPLCFAMFFVQRQVFPASEHLELPGRAPRNAWVQAFDWIRVNTPPNAIFALHPNYMNLPGEDEHGFRAIAERSALASIHDNGPVSMFPVLADPWYQQVQAQRGWNNFQMQDFERLHREYGVTWLVLQRGSYILQSGSNADLACPYRNDVVAVCKLQ